MRTSFGTTAFGVSQRIAPIGQRVLPFVSESASAAVLARVLGQWPSLWGMFKDSKRMRTAGHAYRLAFPNEDTQSFMSRWIASRGEDLAASMVHMARVSAGRHSSLVDAKSKIVITQNRPCIIAVLHYSIDPIVPLAVISSNPTRDFRWPLYPPQSGIEDDRSLWFARSKIPLTIKKTFLPVTKSSWVIAARNHIERGGDIFIAMDAPFDRERRSVASLKVGQATMPMAASIDFLAKKTDAQLIFAWPQVGPKKTWVLHVDAIADTSELACAATRWIENNRLRWAGWPYLRWRETSVSMRRNMARLRETPSVGFDPYEAPGTSEGAIRGKSPLHENREGTGATIPAESARGMLWSP
jgi:hypothetical protein